MAVSRAGGPQSDRTRRFLKWLQSQWRSVTGTVLLITAFALVVTLTAWSSSESPPEVTTQVLLVVVSTALQVAAALLFNQNGRADTTLANASIRRLISMTRKARDARLRAESEYESGNSTSRRQSLGILSAELSWIEEGLAQATFDWGEFHPASVAHLQERDQ